MEKLKYYLLFLIAFTLPMYMRVNNIVLAVYIFVVLSEAIYKRKNIFKKKVLLRSIPLISFFFLAVIASLSTENIIDIKYLEKYWIFLLIPVVFISQTHFYYKYKEAIYKGLILGVLCTLFICEFNAVYEVIVNKEPLNYFLRWRHLGHEFTAIADTHPSYLGIFVCASIYLILNNVIVYNKVVKITLLMFFTFSLFQLVSRMALVICVLTWFVIVLKSYKKHFRMIGSLMIILIGIIIVFFTFGSGYLKDRVFSSNKTINDSRINRWGVSYEIFLDNPVLGIGFNSIKKERVKRYNEKGYNVAAQKEYNAHNQFFEYLSVNGVLGGVVFLGVFYFLLYNAIKEKDFIFIFIFTSFFIANITESMLVRIKGIEFFVLFASLFLSKLNTQKKAIDYNLIKNENK
jgi:O-antigen ligase